MDEPTHAKQCMSILGARAVFSPASEGGDVAHVQISRAHESEDLGVWRYGSVWCLVVVRDTIVVSRGRWQPSN